MNNSISLNIKLHNFRKLARFLIICIYLLYFQPQKLEAAFNSPNYIHKIHHAAKSEEKSPVGLLKQFPTVFESEDLPPVKTNELWSVARLSLECSNNIKEDPLRSSFYHHLNQIHQRSGNTLPFHHHHHLSHHIESSNPASHPSTV